MYHQPCENTASMFFWTCPGAHGWNHSITVWWHGGAGSQAPHRQHSAAPRLAFDEISWRWAVLAQGGQIEIWRSEGILGHDEPHKMRWSINAWQECRRNHRNCMDLHTLGKGWWDQVLENKQCDNSMMFMYLEISQLDALCYWIHFHHLCLSVCINIERFKYCVASCYVENLETATKTNMINKIPRGCGTLQTTTGTIWHQVSSRACTEVSAAHKVSCSPVLRFQLLSNSPEDLRGDPYSSKMWVF
jgi:hypothetical protein